jgi:ATP-binding cassette subfamily C protein
LNFNVFLRIIISALDVLAISLFGVIGLIATSPGDAEQTIKFFGISIVLDLSLYPIGYFIFAAVFLFLFKTISTILVNLWQSQLLQSIDTQMARKVSQYYFLSIFEKVRTRKKSEIQWAIIESVIQGFNVTLSAYSSIISNTFSLALIAVLLLGVDPVASIFVFIYFAAMALVVNRFIGKKQKKLGIIHSRNTKETINAIEDSVATYKENYVSNNLNQLVDHVMKFRSGMSWGISQNQFLGSMPRLISEVSLMVGLIAFVAFQFSFSNPSDAVATLAIFIAAGIRILSSLGPLQNSIASLQNASSQSDAAFSALSEGITTKSVEFLSDKGVDKNLGVAVTITNLDYKYPDSTSKVLEQINLEIKPGSFVALIGPSGSGKTTLIDLILGLFEPTNGNISLDGKEPNHFLKHSSGQVAYVPQKPGLISGSIRENITLSSMTGTLVNNELLDRAVRLSRLEVILEDLPQGLEYEVNSNNTKLSGGQIQRIGLARAFYKNPRLIVLDEATSSLDAIIENDVSSEIERLRPHTTLLVIAHRLATVQNAEKVFLLESGKIRDSGTLSELRARNPLVKKYIDLMSFENIDVHQQIERADTKNNET